MAITSTTLYTAKDLTALAVLIQTAISTKTCATVNVVVVQDKDGNWHAIISFDT